MTILFKILKLFLKIFAYGALALGVIVAAGIAVLWFSPAANQAVADYAASRIATVDQTIVLKGTDGLLTGKLRVAELDVADSEGTYASVRDLEIDWNPWSLLSGEFSASRIAAAEITASRLPVTTLPKDPDAAPFTLPVTIDIASLSLPHVVLGKELAGTEKAISVSGKGQATADLVKAVLDIADKSRADATAVVDVTFNPQAETLNLTTRIDEPANGIVANLLKLPDTPPVTLTLSGDGPIANWSGHLDASVSGNPALALDFRHQASTEGKHDIQLAGGGEITPLVPPFLRGVLSGMATVDMAASFDANGTVSISKGLLATDTLALDAAGSLDPQGQSNLTANLTPKQKTIAFAWPLADGQLSTQIESLALTLSGPANATKIQLKTSLLSLAVPQGTASGVRLTASSSDFDLQSLTGTANVDLAIDQAAMTDPNLARLINGPVDIKAPLIIAADQISADGVTLESGALGGSADLALNRADNGLSAGFKLFALPTALPEALGQKLSGTVALSGQATVLNGAVAVTDLTVAATGLEAKGDLSLADNVLKSAFTAKIANIAQFSEQGTGALTADVTAEGPLDTLAVTAALDAPKLTLAGRKITDLKASITGTASAAKPAAHIAATGRIDGQAINVETDLISENGIATIPAISVAIGKNTLTGALTFSPSFLPTGTIDFKMPDIGLVAALAGQVAGGDLAGRIEIASKGDRIDFAVKANGAGITTSGLSIVAPDINLTASDILSGDIAGSVTAKKIASGSNALTGLQLGFDHAGSKTKYDLKATYDNAPLVSSGVLSNADGSLAILISSFSATPRKIPVKLAAPATISIADGTARFQSLTLATGKGQIAVSGSAGKSLDITAKISNLPAALANGFAAGLGADGTISGTVTVKGTPAAPAVNFTLDWASAILSQTRSLGLGALRINAKGAMSGSNLNITTSVKDGSGMSLGINGSVNLSKGPGLGLKITGTVPFDAIDGLVASQGIVIVGSAKVDLSVNGSAAAPGISGTISTSGARLTDVRRNLTIQDLASTVRLNGKTAVIESLKGSIGKGGTITASGTVGLTPENGLPADLSIKMSKVSYSDGNIITAQLGGDLTLKGPLLSAPVLGGKIKIARATINVPERMAASLAEINVQHKNATKAVAEQKQAITPKKTTQSKSNSDMGLDLQIIASRQVFVRGRGIDAELGGQITLRGTAANPVVSGALKMIRGRMDILGRRLDFSSGSIGFGGNLTPTLNMVASTTAQGSSIAVTVNGDASNPTISFSSSPALPQDEVIAKLIFGRSLSNLSALQIAQLADAVQQLAGGRSGSVFNSLRNRLGVDDLDVSTDSKGQAQVRAGKYLNNRTYLEVQQGADRASSKAAINLDIGKGVKLRGEAGADGAGAAGIFYEKEY